MIDYEPHELAKLFPPLSPDEFEALAQDIAANGQWEPIRLYEGRILDGVNRLFACRRASEIKGQAVEPWIEDFNPQKAKMSAEQFVVSRNLRRRHLTTGQLAVLAVEWAEKAEREGFLTHVAKTAGETGRPRSSALPEISVLVGTTEQRAREAKRIRDASPELFAELKAGRVSLRSALAEIQPPSLAEAEVVEVLSSEDSGPEPEPVNLDQPELEAKEPMARPTFAPSPFGVPPPARPTIAEKPRPAEPAAKTPPSDAVMNKALERIKDVFGKLLHAEVKGGLIPDKWDVVAFSKLPDTEMRNIAPLLRRGWIYSDAVEEVAGRLSPDDEIRALHSRTVAAGGRLKTTVAGFVHIVALQDQAQGLEERLSGW